jgi:hypothetical protein
MKKFKELKSQLKETQLNEIKTPKAPYGLIVSRDVWNKEVMKHKQAAGLKNPKPGLPGGTLQGPKGFVLAMDKKIEKIQGDVLGSNGKEWLVIQYYSHKNYGLKLLATFTDMSTQFTYYIIK